MDLETKVEPPETVLQIAGGRRRKFGPIPGVSTRLGVPPGAARAKKIAVRKLAKVKKHLEGTKVGIAAQVAAGIHPTRIAESLGMSKTTVQSLRSDPEIRQMIEQFRTTIRDIELSKVQGYVGRLHDRIDREVDSAEAKDLRDLTGAALNIEKASASAAGQPTTVIQAAGQAPTEEAKALLVALLGVRRSV